MKKKNFISWLFLITFSTTLSLSFTSGALAQEGVQGAWLLQEVRAVDGSVDNEPLPGLFLFTENHYSIMFASGSKPRAQMDMENTTDAQIREAFGSFTANSGRYERNGNQVITHPYVAKVPNYMSNFPELTQTLVYSRDGDTMSLTFPDGRVYSFQNVDNSPPPWE